jgi:hypothetical protein
VTAIRVKTATGWQDIAHRGPAGPIGLVGIQGAQGPTATMIPMADDQKVQLNIPQPSPNEFGENFSGAYEIYNVAGGDLRCYITPVQNVWWYFECQTIIWNRDAAWNRMDFNFWNDIGGAADELGQSGTRIATSMTIVTCSNDFQWRTVTCHGLYKCKAGSSYAVRPVLSPMAGSNWTFWRGKTYTWSYSRVAGYW